MRTRSRSVVITAVVLLSTCIAAYSQPAQTDAGAQVRKLERAWLDAYEQHDTKVMTAIVADDFLITFPDGSTQSKAQILDMIKSPPDPANRSKFRTEDVKVRVFGDVVVLTGRVIGEYMRAGKAVKDESLYTDTYVRIGQRWQVVASHLSNAPVAK